MAAAAATSIALLFPGISSTTSPLRSKNGAQIAFVSSSKRPCLRVRASGLQTDPDDDPVLISKGDIDYLVKLGGGSVVGAALIKYGSVLFPEITTPNLTQALVTVFFPVILAIFLLIKQSRSE